MEPTRILLVDDSAEFLVSLERFLATIPGLKVVGKAVSGQEALQYVPGLQPNLVLMDLVMPGMNGLEATRKVKALPNAPHVIIMSLHDLANYRMAAESVGADGFISKSEFGERLLPLIHKLIAGPI
jgi:DNA-binding NarL/FixJ family response regulator